LPAWCEAREIDHAFMPEGRRFADLRLLAMDMDSTLITIECIDEIGEMAGRKAEIAAITAQAMRGEIDYTESLRRRVALLQGLEESALGRVYDERLRLTPGARPAAGGLQAAPRPAAAGLGRLQLLHRAAQGAPRHRLHGLQRARHRARPLTGRVIGDIVEAEAKAAKFRSVAKELKARKEQTVAIGDGGQRPSR